MKDISIKERRRIVWNDRLAGIRALQERGWYEGQSAYDIAKERNKLEREANKLLGVTWNTKKQTVRKSLRKRS